MMKVPVTAWYYNVEPTFTDCSALVNWHLWTARYMVNSMVVPEFVPFPRQLFELLLTGLPQQPDWPKLG